MKISTVIIGIALFAIVTMILYGWGIVKQKNQTSDLMNLLFSIPYLMKFVQCEEFHKIYSFYLPFYNTINAARLPRFP